MRRFLKSAICSILAVLAYANLWIADALLYAVSVLETKFGDYSTRSGFKEMVEAFRENFIKQNEKF